MNHRRSRSINRRRILQGGLAVAAALASNEPARAASIDPAQGSIPFRSLDLRFVDLTHKLTKAFNFGQARPRIDAEAIDGSGKTVGMRLNRLSLVEHTGTRIDAPGHFDANGKSLGDIPISDLVVPLALPLLTPAQRCTHEMPTKQASSHTASCGRACAAGVDRGRDVPFGTPPGQDTAPSK